MVVSISVDEDLLREVDEFCKKLGLGCRSEAFRAGVRMLLSDAREQMLPERVDAILMVVHDQKHEAEVSQVKHAFDDIVTTQIHSHLRNNRCLDLFILSGEGRRISEMVRIFRSNRKIDHVRLVVP